MPGPDTKKTMALEETVDYSPIDSGKKKKKSKNRDVDGIVQDSSEHQVVADDCKKVKKKKKKGDDSGSPQPLPLADEPRKKKKKRESSESPEVERKHKLAKSEPSDSADSEQGSEVVNPYAVSNFKISDALRQKLKSKGIEALFPIQALTFNAIYEGNDLVGRARTGQGKTLAFVLPILESLKLSDAFKGRSRAYGRAPSVLVLAPTRELAKQVHADFEFYGEALGLSTVCIYGGAPYGPQQGALRKGVDVVVGTPGRVKDHLERGSLNLKTLKFRVLDEADEMLNMGFVDDVETILGHVEDATTVQTLLFSATMPDWVQKIASRFLKATKETVDLVGDEKMKASSSVRHLLLPCARSARAQLIPDVISCYSSGGRTIIFTETKNNASELASVLPAARVLHGDIAQGQREVTLAGFRTGKFSVLVATDVAARGLDINDVQLIIQCEPPRDVEAYIHRSGRTGRAGKTGISVLFNDRSKDYMIPNIERKAGFQFERISAPHPADIARSCCASAQEKVLEVSDSVLSIFRPAAEQLLESGYHSAADLLAKALARIAGHTDVKKRSLLSSQDNHVTVMLQTGRPFYTPTYAFSCLKRVLPEETVEKVKGMSITVDGLGAVFDVPVELLEDFTSAQGGEQRNFGTQESFSITVPDSLPELQTRSERNNFGRGSGFGGGRGRSGHGGGSTRFGRSTSNRGGFRGGNRNRY